MKNDPKNTAKTNAKKTTSRKWKSRWKRIVSTLAAVTVFCTTYALILPAITVSSDTYCGLEEHEHTEDCYTLELICGYEEGDTESSAAPSGTTVTETVTETETEIQEVLVDEGHIHQDSCYEEIRTLTCGQEESEGKEAVIDEETGEAIEEAVPGHTHTEDCYTVERVLTCGQEEREPVYEQREVEVEKEVQKEVEQPVQGAPHVHTEDCYKKVLTCGKEEHKHTDECFSNPTLDVETAAVWEKTLPKEDELTGNWAEDVITIAKSQLGYKESTRNFKVVDGERKGYNRYGVRFGAPYSDWCAMFIQFCMHYAGVDERLMPANPGVETWIRNVSKMDNFFLAEDYTPQPGDIIFFDWDSKRGDDLSVRAGEHVGLVVEVKTKEETTADGAKVEVPVSIVTIEGNSNNEVRYNTYKIDDDCIMGYSKMPEKPETEEELEGILEELEELEGEELNGESEAVEAVIDPKDLIVDLVSFTESGVQVNFTAPASVLPEGVVDPALNVVEILPGTEEYEAYKAEAAGQIEDDAYEVTDARFFDIKVVDIDGNEIQLVDESLAKVEIIFPVNGTISEDGEINVLHFAEEGLEVLGSETEGSGEVDTVSFDTPGFSVFGVVQIHYTVDFYYTVPTDEDAKEEAEPVINEYHLIGGGTMMMSELFAELGVDRDAADIAYVEFTDTSLVSFTRHDDDYLITSLRPFQTAEVLTITFENGDVIIIGVEDYYEAWDNWYTSTAWSDIENCINDRVRAGESEITIVLPMNGITAATHTINIPSGVKVTIKAQDGYIARDRDVQNFNGSFFNVAEGAEFVIERARFTGLVTKSDSANFSSKLLTSANTTLNNQGVFITSAGKTTVKECEFENINSRGYEYSTNQGQPLESFATMSQSGLSNTAPIVSNSGSLTIEDSQFHQNYLYEPEANATTAGVAIARGDLTIKNTDVTNTIANGAMIIHENGTGSIENSNIYHNRVLGVGAAPVIAKNGADLTLNNADIYDNIAQYPHWKDHYDGSLTPSGTNDLVSWDEFDALYKAMSDAQYIPVGGDKGAFETNQYRFNRQLFYGDWEGEGYNATAKGYLDITPSKTAGALIVDGAKVTMKNGSAMNENIGDHGAVLIKNNGIFVQESDTEINNNRGYNAGAVGISSGEFTMNGGEVSHNTGFWFGTINVSSQEATFNMNGASKIDDNVTMHKGGAIYVNSDHVHLNSGTISNNSALVFGGGIYVEHYCTMILESAEIYENKAVAGADNEKFKGLGWPAYWTGAGETLHGGGYWSCPTGVTYFNSEDVAIHDNEATRHGQDFTQTKFANLSDFETENAWYEENLKTNTNDPASLNVGSIDLTNTRNSDNYDFSKNGYKVKIFGNAAANGGGIASNGNLGIQQKTTTTDYQISFNKKYDTAADWHDVHIKVKFYKGDEVLYEEGWKEINAQDKNAVLTFNLPTVTYTDKKITKSPDKEKYEQAQAYEKLYNMAVGVGFNNIPDTNYRLEIVEEVKMDGVWKPVGDTVYKPEISVNNRVTNTNENESITVIDYQKGYETISSLQNHGTTIIDKIVLTKRDDNNKSLSGATFHLWSFDGQRWDDYLTDSENGTVFTVSMALEDGTRLDANKLYYLAEDEAPQGYDRISRIIPFRIENNKFQIITKDTYGNWNVSGHYDTTNNKFYTGNNAGNGQNYDTGSRKRSNEYTHVMPASEAELTNAGVTAIRGDNSIQIDAKDIPQDIVLKKVSTTGDSLAGAQFVLLTTEDLSAKNAAYVNVFAATDPVTTEQYGYGITYVTNSKFGYNNSTENPNVADKAFKFDDQGFLVDKAGNRLHDDDGNFIRYLTDRLSTSGTNYRSMTFTTDSSGEVSLGALPAGTYKLVEVKAPTAVGYLLPDDNEITITVDSNGKITSASGTEGSLNATPAVTGDGTIITVKNEKIVGEIILSKELIGAGPNGEKLYGENTQFTFDVIVMNEKGEKLTTLDVEIYNADGTLADTLKINPSVEGNGRIVGIKADQTARISNIPYGYSWQIRESTRVRDSSVGSGWMGDKTQDVPYRFVKYSLNGVTDMDLLFNQSKFFEGTVEENETTRIQATNREIVGTAEFIKKVESADSATSSLYDSNDYFYFEGSLTGPGGNGDHNNGYNSDNYVAFIVYDKNYNVINDTLIHAGNNGTSAGNQNLFGVNGARNVADISTSGGYTDTFKIAIKKDWTVKFISVPIGATLNVKETNLDASKYEFVQYVSGETTANDKDTGLSITTTRENQNVRIQAVNREVFSKLRLTKNLDGAGKDGEAIYGNDTLYKFEVSITSPDGTGYDTWTNGVTFSVYDKDSNTPNNETLVGFTTRTTSKVDSTPLNKDANNEGYDAIAEHDSYNWQNSPSGLVGGVGGNGIRDVWWLSNPDRGIGNGSTKQMTFWLKAGQSIEFNRLPVGARWTVKEIIPAGSTMAEKYELENYTVKVGDAAAETKNKDANNGTGGTITGMATTVVVTANNQEKTGELAVEKVLKDALSGSEINDDKVFEITGKIYRPGTEGTQPADGYKYEKDGVYYNIFEKNSTEPKTNEEGLAGMGHAAYNDSLGGRPITDICDASTSKLSLKLKAGQRIVFYNLPIGAKWELQEASQTYPYEFVSYTGATTENGKAVGEITKSGSNATIVVNNKKNIPEIQIKKVDTARTDTTLEGAEFQIYYSEITKLANMSSISDRPFVNVFAEKFSEDIDNGDNNYGYSAQTISNYKAQKEGTALNGTLQLNAQGFLIKKSAPSVRLVDKQSQLIRCMPKYADRDRTFDGIKVSDANITFKTGSNGIASLGALPDGTYYIVETKAPAGYNKLTDAIQIRVQDGKVSVIGNSSMVSYTDMSEQNGTCVITVQNSAGEELPETGGIGTTIIYVLGAILVVGAGVLLIVRRRNKN